MEIPFSLSFVPVFPWETIMILGGILISIGIFGVIRHARGSVFRLLAFVILLLALAGPRHQLEQHVAQDDVAIIVVDRSPSQQVENRTEQVETALDKIKNDLGRETSLDVRIVETDEAVGDDGTRLLSALALASADIPPNRFAGAVMITDGQVHDADDLEILSTMPDGPLHTLLSGEKQSFDRRIVIEKIPAYGLVGQEIDLSFRVEQTIGTGTDPGLSTRPVTVSLAVDGVFKGAIDVRPGRSTSFRLKLEHADASVIELSAEAAEGELSLINNTGVATINGVRDRLRVMLISGQPHAGERMWRNLLKSDPAVDLVHFTILRPPEKSDFTPIGELSLISFPTFELFDIRLHEFDLIVFDRYIVRHVLTPRYFRNIANYMRDGGAILVAMGPEFAGTGSLSETPLGPMLPSRPTGNIIEQTFQPSLTDAGLQHPVTAGLSETGLNADGATARTPDWGRWFRQIETVTRSGNILMNGIANRPLLILDRVENGRVGVLTSDHIWLWSRGFDGGGPQAELVRRLAHWLMKEPALEEERLSAALKNDALEISRRSLDTLPLQVTVTAPSGETHDIGFTEISPGHGLAQFPISAPGVYRMNDGELTTLTAVGSLNPVEYRDMKTTDDILGSVSAKSGGGVFWLSEITPEIRRIKPDHKAAGTEWIGLRKNQSFVVSGIAEIALMPWWLSATLILSLLFGAWWREGK